MPPDPGNSCPGDIVSTGAFSCMEAVYDAGRHVALVRYGEKGSFGFLHAYLDHNLDLQPITDTFAQNYGYREQNVNSTTRFTYTEMHTNRSGQVDQYVVLFEERAASSRSSDRHELGLLTGYCTNGAGVQENMCPDWVNSTL